ncbi:MAG TPA: glycosyltransferase family 4 protein [Steroidobacteraceae bacterium]
MTIKSNTGKEQRRVFCVVTQGEVGGAQRFVLQLAHHLNRDHFKMHVVWGAESDNALANALPPHATHATVRHLVRNISPWQDLRAIYELRRQMANFRPDIVLCISSKAGFVGALAATSLRTTFPGLKVIYRIGGWTFNDPWPTWKKRLYVRLEWISARWKDIIVLNNSSDFDQAHRLGIRPRRNVVRIYNGLDAILPILERGSARTFLGSLIPEPSHAIPYEWLVGTIANFYPTKDLSTLVRAAALTAGNVRFLVMGDGPQRTELENLIAQYELEGRFLLLGRVNDAWRYLAALDIFVLSSVKEGFPWVLLEAMAAMVPVVATCVGAVPEIIDDGVSGIICEPAKSEQLAEAIGRLLNNEKLRNNLAIKGRQQVLNRFSLTEMIAQYEKLLG